MDKALIVSSQEKGIDELCSLLKASGLSHISISSSCSDARRRQANNSFEIIIINTPLTDEFGTSLALHCTKSNAGIVMLVKAELADQISYKVENEGIYVISKPIHKTILYQAIKMGVATHRRIMGIKNENKQLQKKLEEVKVVDRAKCILIQYLSMSEAQAHRFIEKQAMDMRISKTSVAEGILKTYES